LLAFGRRQHLEMKVIDLSLLINGLLKMIRRLIGASIEVSFSASTNVFWTRADSGQIEQVILNLCINARDAMPKGGRLVIELDRTSFSVEDVADHPWLRSGDFVQLSISDTGCGMDKATLARIFEPFYTTKPLGKGTGLGLSVVQGVVQQHKGMINVYSEPEHGTTFRIYLPEALRPSAQAELGAPTVVSVKPGLTILFAEDDAVVRSTTTTLLRRSGYKVVPVGDGQEACEFVENGQHCDLALLDIVMPKMSGLEAAQIIRTKISGIPVVLCSGYSAKIVESGQISDDFRFLGKPYSGEELLRTLASALSYK
jgi:CheY-like chemotaxis protein